MPEDEVAVAIDDVAVNPGTVAGGGPSTTSVEVITPALSSGYRSSYRRDPSPYSALLASDASKLRRERVSTDTGSHVAVVDVPDDEAGARRGARDDRSRSRRIASSTSTARPVPHRTAASTASSTRRRCTS